MIHSEKKKTCFLLFFVVLSSIINISKAQDIQSDTIWLKGNMGKICTILERPQIDGDAQQPLVIFMHGISGSKDDRLLTNISQKLLKKKVATLRFDFNGHGASEGAFSRMTIENEIIDAKNIFDYASRIPNIGKIAIVGYSQGGVVASMLAGLLRDTLSSLVLLSPAAVIKDYAMSGNFMGVKFSPQDIPDSIKIYNGKYLGKKYIESAIHLPIYEISAFYKGPTCIFHGTKDSAVPLKYSQEYYNKMKGSELHLIDGENHGFRVHLDSISTLVCNYLMGELVYKPTLSKGEKVPEIVSTTEKGETVKLSNWLGKYVVLDFWASWCGDCRREIPHLKKLHEEYKGKKLNTLDIDFLSISFDYKKEAWLNMLEKEKFAWTQASNLKSTREDPIFKEYQLHWIPAFLVIDGEGKLAGSAVTADGLKALLRALNNSNE